LEELDATSGGKDSLNLPVDDEKDDGSSSGHGKNFLGVTRGRDKRRAVEQARGGRGETTYRLLLSLGPDGRVGSDCEMEGRGEKNSEHRNLKERRVELGLDESEERETFRRELGSSPARENETRTNSSSHDLLLREFGTSNEETHSYRRKEQSFEISSCVKGLAKEGGSRRTENEELFGKEKRKGGCRISFQLSRARDRY